MASKLPIANVNEVATVPYGKGDTFQAALAGIGRDLGAKKIGCTLVVLEPGKRAWPYHLHYAEEEMFVILEGEGMIRYDGEEHPVHTGDVIFTPTGPNTAHQIVNNSSSNLRYLALSSLEPAEVCYYPDSDKYGSYFGDGEEGQFVAPANADTDYWVGEET